ncbi:MAG TPA: SUMF1/EgtB/PvdO family nonheme iron enzyme [Dongiaceae bacterium]|nr:SUMF1/EgtB/PvdO family nonheme iron enzyme [Dongiaceae bacterium]
MKPLTSITGTAVLALLCSALTAAGDNTPVPTSITWDAGNPTNQILLTWYATPTKEYQVLTTPALGRAWQPLTNGLLAASNNLVRFGTQAGGAARFYRVVKRDTDPPAVARLWPADGAMAVPPQSQLMVWLQDETGVDPNSISLAVGTNAPVTLSDPRLSFQNGLLTYTPATNQFLGANGQFVTNQLVVADTLGNRGTNAWGVKLALAPVLAPSVVIISPSSPLTLLSTNGSTFVFSYTNASSGLTNGSILVSTDTNFAYKLLVLSVADNPAGRTVSLVTTQAALADILVQGSVRFLGTDFVPDPGLGAQPEPKDLGTTIQLGPTTLYTGGGVEIDVPAGQLSFSPDFTIAAEFGATPSFDLDINATMEFDLTLHASWQHSWNWSGSQGIGTPIHQFKLLGWIPTPIPIPVWAEAVWEFNVGAEAQVAAQAGVTAGFASSWNLDFGTHLRNGQWTPYATENVTVTPYPLSWQGTGSGQLTAYVEPKLTVCLESLAGPTADLKPYLELDVAACVQPGQAGADAWLYDGLSSTLALDVRFWNENWGNLPSWELFNLRQPVPGAHWSYTTPVGAPMQTIPNMAWIPCGTFVMGSPASEAERASDETQHAVTLTRGFYMRQYLVTQADYLAVVGNNPSYFTTEDWYGNPIAPDLSRPVEQVSWDDVTAYCAALTAREQVAGRLAAGWVYRLPTESEWEYACRAGTTTAFYCGSALRSGMANFIAHSEYDASVGTIDNPNGIFLACTTPVGSYQPNAWGLYDMAGNVWEWCWDWYGTYPTGSVADPSGPASGSGRVIRGGGWFDYAWYCRSAYRADPDPSLRYLDLGFRVVLAPGQP